MTYIARQPINGLNGQPIGCELFDRSGRERQHSAAGDAALLFGLLHNAEPACHLDKGFIFINCTMATFGSGHLGLVETERFVLEVPPLPEGFDADEVDTYRQTLVNVKRMGFKLAFRDQVLTEELVSLMPLADFIKVPASVYDDDVLQRVVHYTTQHSHAQLIASRLETQAEVDRAIAAGFTLLQGYWVGWPAMLKGHSVRPQSDNILALYRLVSRKASTTELVDFVHRDPALAYNLLRYMRTSGLSKAGEEIGVKQAIARMGLRRLFRWTALMAGTPAGEVLEDEVRRTSLVRARQAQIVATNCIDPALAEQAYLAGLFSTLDQILGLSMVDVVASLQLGTEVRNALVHSRGSLAPVVQLVNACEQSDDWAFAEACTALGLSGDEANLSHMEALVWADDPTMPWQFTSTTETPQDTVVDTLTLSFNGADLAPRVMPRMQLRQAAAGHMGIYGGGGNISVAQQQLHRPQVGPMVEQVGGKGVAQGVGRQGLSDT